MGLDVYVGTLTRYYGGDWETVVQQIYHGRVAQRVNQTARVDIADLNRLGRDAGDRELSPVGAEGQPVARGTRRQVIDPTA